MFLNFAFVDASQEQFNSHVFMDSFQHDFISETACASRGFFSTVPDLWIHSAQESKSRSFSRGDVADFDARFSHDSVDSHSLRKFIRIGEASVPGPVGSFRVSTINPTKLHGRVSDVVNLQHDICTTAENSVTIDAQHIIHGQFKKAGVNSLWGEPVPVLADNAGTIRGKAAGVSIHTPLPLHPCGIDLPSDIQKSSRLLDGIVHLSSHVACHVGVIYAPPHNDTYASPSAILNRLTFAAAERAVSFKGPAFLSGDWNVELENAAVWPFLRERGWIDAAALAATWHHRELQPTCRDVARKSFILVNPILAQSLVDCYVCEEYLFPQHPILVADFNIQVCIQDRLVWSLPDCTDDCILDDELLTEQVETLCSSRGNTFQNHIDNGDAEKALKVFVNVWEDAVGQSCITSDGQSFQLPKRFFGRCQKEPWILRKPSSPTIKPGREGDYSPNLCQASISIRRHTKQLRRIQSLERQLIANCTRRSEVAAAQCQRLWSVIVFSNGFHHGFQNWMLQEMGFFIPCGCPDIPFVVSLRETFRKYLDLEILKYSSEQTKRRKLSVAIDIAKGGANAYRSLRSACVPPAACLASIQHFPIRPTKWSKGGVSVLLLASLDKTPKVGDDISFQGQFASINRIEGFQIFLDRKVRLKDAKQMFFTHKKYVAQHGQMQQIVADGWNEFWQRDKDYSFDDEWDQILCQFHSLHDCPSCPFQAFDETKWRALLSKISCKSARGSCGFSVKELRKRPSKLTAWLFEIFRIIEDGCPWPKCLTFARVVMIPKGDSQPEVGTDLRPITILSRLYRAWAKYRASEALSHLSKLVPAQIGGVVSGVSADLLTAWVTDLIEDTVEGGREACGIVIDLKKCFNLIPRRPLCSLLEKIGIHSCVILSWMSMLMQMNRVIDFAGSLSNPQISFTGIPEGCPLSVIGMMAVAWLASAVTVGPRDVLTPFFADNWAIIAYHINDLKDSIRSLEDFLKSWKMVTSPEKCWVWGTSRGMRHSIKSVTIDGVHPPAVLVNKDLGCDVSYCQKKTKVTTKKRWSKAIGALKRLKQRCLPKSFKKQASTTAGFGTAVFGIEMVHHTKTEWGSLRSAIAASVDRFRAGANSLLALSTGGDMLDPQLRAIVRRCLFWRKFCKVFPDRRNCFINRLSFETRNSKVGPAFAFVNSMADMGWQCLEEGNIMHRSGITLNWLCSSVSHLKLMMRICWNFEVCQRLSHRPGFVSKCFDHLGFARSASKRDINEKGLLYAWASGKHLTSDCIYKFSKRVSSEHCPLCHEKDGKQHRLNTCKHLDDIRFQYEKGISFAKQCPEAVQNFGICPFDIDFIVWKQQQAVSFPELHLPERNIDFDLIFTDGSCFCGECPYYAIASAAAIKVLDEGGYEVIGALRLPGIDMSSFRAEIYGVEIALQASWSCVLFIDCQSVCDVLNTLCLYRALGCQPPKIDHWDLWQRIWWHLQQRPCDAVKVEKISSHTDWRNMNDGQDKWAGEHSEIVDTCAKDVLRIGHKGLLRTCTVAFQRWSTTCDNLSQFHDFWIAACQRCFKHSEPHTEVRHCGPPDFSIYQIDDTIQGVFPCIPSLDEFLIHWQLGRIFGTRFLDWWSSLEWVPASAPISALELYINFALDTGTMVPVQPTGKGSKFLLRDLDVQADLCDAKLALQNKTWIRGLKHVHEFFPHALVPSWLNRENTLNCFGYTIKVISLSFRPKLKNGAHACKLLWDYFHTNTGVQRDLKRPWRCHRKRNISAGG